MAVAFDAAGGPSYNSINSYTTSWTHTLGASANCIIVAIASTTQGGVNTPTVGGVAMTLLAGPLNFINTFGAQFITLFGLMNPGTGAKTVNASVGSFAGYGITGASVSYSGVIGFGRAATAAGASNACSVTVGAPDGGLAVAAMTAVTPTGTTITAFNGTSRVNAASPAPGGYAAFPLLLGDKAGTGQTTLTGTAAGTTYTATGNAAVSLLGDYIPEANPQETLYSAAAGTFTYTIPSWAQKFDVAVLGGGGSGDIGGAGFNTGGGGGKATWQTATWHRGIDMPLYASSFTVVVGAGGTGPPSFGTRQAGGSSSVTAYGSVITSTGGITHIRLDTGHGQSGDSATGITFSGVSLPGGTGGTGDGGNAGVYGSGGAGGNGVFAGSTPGGDGSRGYVYIKAYGDRPAFFPML